MKVPPYSLLVCRADLQHAGPAGMDCDDIGLRIRHQTLFPPHNYMFPDSISIKGGFEPSYGSDSDGKSGSS